MGSMIPGEYQEVEYIESTGTQYIDLPFGFLDTDDVETVFSVNVSETRDKYIVSPIQWNTSNNRFGMGVYVVFCFAYGKANTSTTRMVPNNLNDGKLHNWVYHNHVCTITDVGSSVDVSDIGFGTESVNLRLFYGYNATTKGKIAFYHHKKQNGTEVNLLPCYRKSDNEIGMYDTVSKTFFTNSGTGTFLKGNDVSHDRINLLEARRKILLNTPHIEQASGNLLSFNTDIKASLKDCKIYFTPVQEGSGTPSPENVRPIHGWDGVTVTRCGKNLFDENGECLKGKYINNNGVNTDVSGLNATANLFTTPIYVSPNTQYVVRCSNPVIRTGNAGKYWNRIIYYDASGNFISRTILEGGTLAFTTPSNCAYILNNPSDGSNIQIELGSTATTYEPYQSSTLTIPFPQTIYGGYVDLIKGEVVEESVNVVFDGTEDWRYYNPQKCFYLSNESWERVPTRTNVLGCNMYAPSNFDYVAQNNYPDNFCSYMTNNGGFAFWDYEIASNAGKAYLQNLYSNGTPLEAVCILKTPNTYPLTPQTIKTLKGINNLWSNANGNISIKFWTH